MTRPRFNMGGKKISDMTAALLPKEQKKRGAATGGQENALVKHTATTQGTGPSAGATGGPATKKQKLKEKANLTDANPSDAVLTMLD